MIQNKITITVQGDSQVGIQEQVFEMDCPDNFADDHDFNNADDVTAVEKIRLQIADLYEALVGDDMPIRVEFPHEAKARAEWEEFQCNRDKS